MRYSQNRVADFFIPTSTDCPILISSAEQIECKSLVTYLKANCVWRVILYHLSRPGLRYLYIEGSQNALSKALMITS